jgi:hypothetical protein
MSPVHYLILRDIQDSGSLAQGSYSELIERAKASCGTNSKHEHHHLGEGGEGGDYNAF